MSGFAVPTASASLQIAQAYITETIGYEEKALDNPGLRPLAQRIRDGAHDARKFSLRDLAAAVQRHGQSIELLTLIVTTAESARLWKRQPVAYRVHPELAHHLVEMDNDREIPCEVFRRLPHANAFTVFPEPVIMADVSGALPQTRPGEYVGMFVTGQTADGEVCSSDDPRTAWLNVALAGRVFYVGQGPTYEEHTVRVPVTGVMRVEDMIRRQRAQAMKTPDPDSEDWEAFLLAVNLLLYLCSNHADISAPDPAVTSRARKEAKRRRQKPPPVVVDLGFDIGPKLFAGKHTSTGAGSAPAGTGLDEGRSRRAHLRRAHFHTYWLGPRDNQHAEIRWLSPILVGDGHGRPMVIDGDDR